MKKLTSILLFDAVVFSLAACSESTQPDVNGDSSVSTRVDNTSPIPIAFIGSMTGLDEIYGYVSYSAAKMAVEQINEAGGVAGRQIELKCYDDRAEGIEAVNCARKAILDDGCIAILTASSTAGLISINAVLEEFEVPCIAYAIGAELVTHDEQGNTRPYMFRVNTTSSQCTELIGRYSADVLGYRKAAIFYDITNSSGADGVTYFTKGFESKGGKVTEVEAYKTGDVGFRAVLCKLKGAGDFDML